MPVSTTSSLSSRRSDRLGWVDVTRGSLILLVIFYHVTTVHVPSIATFDGQQFMLDVSTFLRPIRMPLFFVISGFLAVGSFARPWSLLIRSKVAFFYWIYVIWLVIQTLMPTALVLLEKVPQDAPLTGRGDVPATLVELLRSATFAPSNLWFLYALAVYFPLAKLVRPLGLWPLLPAFAVYLVSVDGWGLNLGQLPAVAAYFFFFLIGTSARPLLERCAARPRISVTVVAAALFIALFVLETTLPTGSTVLLALSSVLAIRVGIAGSVFLSRRSKPVAGLLAFLGARTLPIYVLQMPLVWTWDKLVERILPDFEIDQPVALMAYSLGLTVVLGATAVGLHALLKRPFPLLFAVPWRTTAKAAQHVRVSPRPHAVSAK